MEVTGQNILTEKTIVGILKDVISTENIVDPIFKIGSGSGKGDGYMGEIIRVDIKGKYKNVHVIIKCAPKSAEIRKTAPTRVAYLQEISYYSKVFPGFKKFQEEKGVKQPFKSIPHCYKTDDTELSELLVLENLKEQGFKLFDKKLQMDDAHVEMVMREYGKFHAVSFAMKEQNVELFNELIDGMVDVFSREHLGEEFFEMFSDGADKIKSVFDKETETDIRNYIGKLKNQIEPFFKSIFVGGTRKYDVITHKDGWCNNMMFKYEGNNSTPPTDMRLLDFQLGCATSPVVDLAYFFYNSASQEMLDNLEHFQRIYYDSLSANLLEMGSDPKKCFPFSALKEEWKAYAKYGLIMCGFILRVMLRDDDETLDFTDKADADISLKDTFMKSSKNDCLINEKYRSIGLHFYKNKFL